MIHSRTQISSSFFPVRRLQIHTLLKKKDSPTTLLSLSVTQQPGSVYQTCSLLGHNLVRVKVLGSQGSKWQEFPFCPCSKHVAIQVQSCPHTPLSALPQSDRTCCCCCTRVFLQDMSWCLRFTPAGIVLSPLNSRSHIKILISPQMYVLNSRQTNSSWHNMHLFSCIYLHQY